MFETEEKRLARLKEYEICKKRGHVKFPVGLGDWLICSHCGVQFKFVLVENETTLPTKRAVTFEGTNAFKYVDA